MIEINNNTKSKIDIKLIKKVAEKFATKYKVKNKDISIAFVGDVEIRKLNYKYRKFDKPTDVLAFSGEDNFLGEIVIDYAQIKRQAGLYSDSIKAELVFILIHGLLHLVGYDDTTENGKMEMEEEGKKFVKSL
jgi:probable rRNA maturation factor